MRKYLHKLAMMVMAVAAVGAFSSCDDDTNVDVVVAEPKISSVEYLEDQTTETSVVVEVTFAEAEAICYTHYLATESEGEWSTKSVSIDDTSVEITFSGLEAGTAYKAEFYATNSGEVSATKTLTFSTDEVLPTPEIVSAVSDDELLTQTSALFVVTCSDATSVNYAYYLTSEAASVEKSWASVEVAEGAETVEVALSDLTADSAYTVEFVAVNGEYESAATAVEFATLAEVLIPEITSVAVVDGSLADNSVTIAIGYNNLTQLNYVCYATADSAEKVWVEFPMYSTGAATIEIPFADLTAATEYTAEFVGVNGEIESEAVSVSFTTTDNAISASGETLSFTITAITPFTALLTVDVDESLCEGWAYMSGQAAYGLYTDYIDSSISGGYIDIFEGDCSVVIGGDYALYPSTEYAVAVVGVSEITFVESDWGDYYTGTRTGDLIYGYFATADPEIGVVNESISIALNSTTYASASTTFTRGSENVTGYYYGSVLASDISNGDVESWISATSWFSTAYSNSFSSYDWSTGETTYVDSVDVNFSSLSEGSDYYAFAIPITADGELGQLSTLEFTTGSMSFDSTILYDIDVTPGVNTADVNITFGDRSYKVYYYNCSSGWYSEDQLKTFVMDQVSSDYNYWSVDSATDGVLSHQITYLSMTTEYVLTTIVVDSTGAMGDVKWTYYTTVSPTFDSAATVNVTLASAEKDYYGWMNATVNIEMADGAVKYLYGNLDEAYVASDKAEAYGSYILGNYPSTSTEASLVLSYYSSAWKSVFIPVDADGAYGMPILFGFTQDEWDSYVYVDPDTTTEGGDGSEDDSTVDPK